MALLGEFGYGAMDAMTWFNVAAQKGDSVAMANLASLWAQGRGVAVKNCEVARDWAQKAIAAGYENAKEELQSGFGGQCQW
jgi:TPR repeat protein